MEDDKTLTTPDTPVDDDADDPEDLNELASVIAQIKGQGNEPEKPETDPAPAQEPAEEAPAEEEEPAEQQEPAKAEAPAKPAITDEEMEVRIQAKVQERIDAAVREASQRAADAVLAKERAREDSARKALRDLELRTGRTQQQILAELTGKQVQQLMDERGLDEDTARRLVQAEMQTREMEAREHERQREHAVFTQKAAFASKLTDLISDPNANDAKTKLTRKYRTEIEAFALEAIENGHEMTAEVARDFILGGKVGELEAEYKAELERVKDAAEKRTLKNVQDRSKVKPEASSAAIPSAPTLSRSEREFLRKLGMGDDDIADIAKRQAARKKK